MMEGLKMAIEPDKFAKECVEQSLLLGVNPHYLIAVAEVLSGINDDTADGKIGPFRRELAEWNANGKEPAFDIDLQPDDINLWEMQCQFAALQTFREQKRLLSSLNRYPSPDELYVKWPNVPPPQGKSLKDAIESTKPLVLPAVNAMLAGLGQVAVNNVNLGGLADQKKAMAELIVSAFATAGYGKAQQVAAVANAIAESNLNPKARATAGEDSVGLFQLNRNGGLGTGHPVADLEDPATNTSLIIAECKKFNEFKTASTLQDAVAIFVRKVERPANADGEIVKRLAIAQKLVV